MMLPHWSWGKVFKIKDHLLSGDLQRLIPWSCALLMISLPWNLAGTAFFAYLKIELISVFTLIQSTLLLAGFGLAARYLTFDAAVLSYIGVSILTNLFLTIFLFLKMNWRWEWSSFFSQWKILRSMGKPSFDFFLLCVSAMTANTIGPVISGITQGAHAAGDFTLIQKMFSFLATVHLAILSPIGPAYTLHAKQSDWSWVGKKLHFCIRIIWPILFIGLGSMIYFSHPLILRLWTGKWITNYSLTLLIAATAILAGFANTYSVLLNSLGAVRLQAALSILMILPVALLPIYLGRIYGVWGVALASLLGVIPGCFLNYFYAQYALKKQYVNV
jgi:O-antigen/teichoic acid export membrane protein